MVGPSAVKPMRVWRRLALIVPPWPSAGVAATMFGLSSQLALAEFAKTPAWTVPNSFTGKRVVDSTFVCASSATWVCSISTAGGAALGGTGSRQRVDLRAELLALPREAPRAHARGRPSDPARRQGAPRP